MKNKLFLFTIALLLYKANGYASIITQDTVVKCWGSFAYVNLVNYQTDKDAAKNVWKPIDGAVFEFDYNVGTFKSGFHRYELTFVDPPLISKDTITVEIRQYKSPKLTLLGSSKICLGDSALVYYADSAKLKNPLVWSNGDKGFHTYAKVGTTNAIIDVTDKTALCLNPFQAVTIDMDFNKIQALSVDGSSQICEGDSAKVFFADSALLTHPLIWSNGTKGFHTYIKESSFVKAEIQMQDAKTCFAFDSVLVQAGDCTSSIVNGIILNEDSSTVCLPSTSIDLRDFQMDTSEIKNYWTSLDEPTLKDDHIFEPTAEGIYRFELYFAETILGQPNLYFDTLLIEVKNGCATFINTQSDVSELISVFPNPSSGIITIQKNDVSTFSQNIFVHDVLGNIVMKVDVDASLNNITIDLSSLKHGCYFISSSEGVNIGKVILN